jgi:flagellar motor protein MotB
VREYRRGVLLGLSLAEVFILLLFCFLLLIAPRLAPQLEDGSKEEQPTPLVAVQDQDESTFADTPLALDSIPLTPGLTNPDQSPAPLVEDPADATTETASFSVAFGTNDVAIELDQNPLETPDDVSAGDDNESADNPSNLSDAGTTTAGVGVEEAQSQTDGEHNWPPIIPLDEAAGYSFPTGSAELSESFAEKLKSEIRQKILDHLRDYKANVVEVVGHTDERPINGASNLDNVLIGVFSGEVPAARLSAADNVGLGMARAAAVSQVLQSCIELEGIKVIPYSGGQVIERGDQLATGQNSGDRSERRRIEIRVRRSTEALQ